MNKKPKINNQIKAREVRVISEKGENLGIFEIEKALEAARQAGLDLVEIVPNVAPPIAKIIDFGKYLYQIEKQERQKRTGTKRTEVKGVRIGLKTSRHDMQIKAEQAAEFLKEGHKVRIEMILRGREKALGDFARSKINEFLTLVPEKFHEEEMIKKGPRGLSLVIVKTK